LALEVWPWQKIQAKILADYKIHHKLPLEHGDWSELCFKIQVPYLLTVGNRGLVRVLENKQDFVTFYRNHLHSGMALALSVLALLTSLIVFSI